MVWIRRYKQENLISKISVDSNFTFSSYAWLFVFHCSRRLLCWIKSRVRNFSVKNCSHFIMKWFQPNSFGEVCFLQECTTNMKKKNHILKILTSVSMPYFSLNVGYDSGRCTSPQGPKKIFFKYNFLPFEAKNREWWHSDSLFGTFIAI